MFVTIFFQRTVDEIIILLDHTVYFVLYLWYHTRTFYSAFVICFST